MRDIAKVVRKYIPDAMIEFGSQIPPGESAQSRLIRKVSCARAREDFGFSLLPLEEAILIHINDARLEAGLKPL
jgi:hypothetical protein